MTVFTVSRQHKEYLCALCIHCLEIVYMFSFSSDNFSSISTVTVHHMLFKTEKALCSVKEARHKRHNVCDSVYVECLVNI